MLVSGSNKAGDSPKHKAGYDNLASNRVVQCKACSNQRKRQMLQNYKLML